MTYNRLWTIVELLTSLIECGLITHYISNLLTFKSPENKLWKKSLLFLSTVFNNIFLSSFLQVDAAIGIIQFIIALAFTFIFMNGSYLKKCFAAFSSIFLILTINSTVLFIFSKLLKEDIQVLITSMGIFRLLILFTTKFLYFIVTTILIKLFMKNEYKLSTAEIIYILSAFLVTLLIGNLMFEYSLKINNNFSMIFNIIFTVIIAANVGSYVLLRKLKINTSAKKQNSIIMSTENTDSSFIDAIADSKIKEYSRKKIKLNINCTRLTGLFSESDVGIFMSVILDKTIEHISYDKIKSQIDLHIINEDNHLSFIISFVHTVDFDADAYVNSISEDVVIKSITDKYKGYITYDDKENMLVLNIWLKSETADYLPKNSFLTADEK